MSDVQEQSPQVVTMTINDLIYAVKDLGKRMNRIETRIDKQDAKIEKLADKIDDLRNEIKSLRHWQLPNISVAEIATGIIVFCFMYSVLK